MSSRARLCTSALAVFALVPVTFATGCGSDEEPARDSAQRPSGSASETSPLATAPTTTQPTTPTSTEARRAARRKHRDKRKTQTTSTTTTAAAPATTPQTTPSPPPADDQPAPKPKPPSRPKPKPKPTGPPAHALTESASLHLVSKDGAKAFVHEGAVEGTLDGQMHLDTKIGGKQGVQATFTVTLADGTLTGRGSANITLAQSKIDFRGTATITGGTGTYEGASGSGLKFSGTVPSDASTCTVQLSGTVRY